MANIVTTANLSSQFKINQTTKQIEIAELDVNIDGDITDPTKLTTGNIGIQQVDSQNVIRLAKTLKNITAITSTENETVSSPIKAGGNNFTVSQYGFTTGKQSIAFGKDIDLLPTINALFDTGDNGGAGTGTGGNFSNNNTANVGKVVSPSGQRYQMLVGNTLPNSTHTVQGFGATFGVSIGYANAMRHDQPWQTIYPNLTMTATTDTCNYVQLGYGNVCAGNSSVAIGMLNRVYGNTGICIGTTPIADAYSSAGRFSTTIGFNLKAGEYGSANVSIGQNLQIVGSGNITLGGGRDKYFGGVYSYYDDKDGVISNVGNGKPTTRAGMRLFGDNNIWIGSMNRTEGHSTDQLSSTNIGNGSYPQITYNTVLGHDNTVYTHSANNNVMGSHNIIASGQGNTIIGSGNSTKVAVQDTQVDAGSEALRNLHTATSLTRAYDNVIVGNNNILHQNTSGNMINGVNNAIMPSSVNNTVFGRNNTVTGTNNVVFSSGVALSESNVFYVGTTTSEGQLAGRTIRGVADGAVSATSTEAVTGKQLYALLQEIETLKQRVATLESGA